jgi:hypothetical protein
MADRAGTSQPGHHLGVAVIIADQAEALMGVEANPVMGDNPGRLLAAMLQGMQTQRGNGGGIGDIPDPEDTAFLMGLVVIYQ